jgi:hypothetical protein
MRKLLALAAVAALLAGCQTKAPQDYVLFHAGLDSTTVGNHMTERVATCWFAGKNKAFADYSYSPEGGVGSDRILIVPKSAPHSLPALVIQIVSAKRGTDVKLFGPMMQTGDADQIRHDVMRWTGGARDC